VTPADFIREFWLAAQEPVQPEKATCGHWSDGSEGLFCPAQQTLPAPPILQMQRMSPLTGRAAA